MFRPLALAVLLALPLPALAGMTRSEPVEGVTIVRGPGVSPEPVWRAAAREAGLLRAGAPRSYTVPLIAPDVYPREGW